MNTKKLYERPEAEEFDIKLPLNLLETLSAEAVVEDFEEGEDL